MLCGVINTNRYYERCPPSYSVAPYVSTANTFSPLTFEDIIEINVLSNKYPSVPVILGHLGGLNWLDTIKLAKGNSSLYLDLSGTFATIAVSFAIKELPERTLFSSDAPYGDPVLAKQQYPTIFIYIARVIVKMMNLKKEG